MVTQAKQIEVLTDKEKKLIDLIRNQSFAKLEISIENKQPVRVIALKENIVL